MRRYLFVVIVLLFLPVVSAKEGSIKLLALSELSNGSQIGVVTDLSLEINDGKERVFLETFPLTKITTQLAIRVDQQFACKDPYVDCSSYAFVYTIHALQGLVGGPSAGAAAAILTAALLSNAKIDESITITGTINSGGLIGPVGGIKHKIDAAGQNGLRTVLIPRGSQVWREKNNSLDLVEYGAGKNISVVEVATFVEAFKIMTGRELKNVGGELVIGDKYRERMRLVAEDICSRATNAVDEINSKVVNESRAEGFVNISHRAKTAFDNGEFYTAASFCFRTNLLVKQVNILSKKPGRSTVFRQLRDVEKSLNDFVVNTSGRKLYSITDVQTFMAVNERLVEAKEGLLNAVKHINRSVDSANYVAYADERLNSAVAWSNFFGSDARRFEISSASLRMSCMDKISEAEERYNYVKSIVPLKLSDTRKELDRAYADLSNESFILCLHRASKAKASSDVILSVVGVDESQIDDVLDLKLDVVKKEIIRSQERGVFPIIGYSYYEYAKSLRDSDKSSALLFAEYALELTNIDIYFGSKKRGFVFFADSWSLFVLGAMIGMIVVHIYDNFRLARLRKLKNKK